MKKESERPSTSKRTVGDRCFSCTTVFKGLKGWRNLSRSGALACELGLHTDKWRGTKWRKFCWSLLKVK